MRNFSYASCWRASFQTLLVRWSVVLPTLWKTVKHPLTGKTATVTPSYKKDHIRDTTKYRLVRLTFICCNTMEQFIRNSILTHLALTNVMNNAQHRFVPNKYPPTNMLCAQHDISSLVEIKQGVEVVFLDLCKCPALWIIVFFWPNWKRSQYTLYWANRL